MKRTGSFFMPAGVVVAAFGVGQLLWVCYTSPDPRPNPVGSGMLMMACVFAGITLLGVGGRMAGKIGWSLF